MGIPVIPRHCAPQHRESAYDVSNTRPLASDAWLLRHGTTTLIRLVQDRVMNLRNLALLFACLPLTAAPGQDKFPNLLGDGFNLNTENSLSTASNPTVDVEAQLAQLDACTVELRIIVTPPDGFYIYSTATPKGQPTRIVLTETGGLAPAQPGFEPDHAPKVKFSDVFAGKVEKFLEPVTWSRRFTSDRRLTQKLTVSGKIEGQICSTGEGGQCHLLLPPPDFSAELTPDPNLPEPAVRSLPPDHGAAKGDTPESLDFSSGIVVTQTGIPVDEALLSYTVVLTPTTAEVGDSVTLAIRADPAAGHYTYAIAMSSEMSVGTTIDLTDIQGLDPVGEEFSASVAPELNEPIPGVQVETHSGLVVWSREFTVTDAAASITGTIEGLVCSKRPRLCYPPKSVTFAVSLNGGVQTPVAAEESVTLRESPITDATNSNEAEESFATIDVAANARREGLFVFLLAAVGAGFVSLLTPCVFPMIPVTVAFFLKQDETRNGDSKLLAVIYCLGIIVSFTVIGLFVTIIFGPDKMTEIANGPWLNLGFAAVFVAFALALMGVFELRVPAFVLNWSARREGQDGIIGVLFMAITFTLVSFTCTAAFVAPLLVWSAKGQYFWPVLGMLAYSTAFASPFFLLALFPSFLKSLPKSGGWLQKMKCTAGLLELAFVVKFLSVADIGFSRTKTPMFMDFSFAMVLWATVAFVTGLYLLGVFRFSKDTPSDSVSPVGGLWAIGFLGLGLLICVGLFSPQRMDNWVWNRLKGFAPPQFETAITSGTGHSIRDNVPELENARYRLVHEGLFYAMDFHDALEVAQERNRPIFIDFTGVNCINCRDMEASVLNQPSVLSILSTLPRAQLFLDEMPIVQARDEADRLLNLNRELSLKLTGGRAMPTYVVLAPDGETVMSSTSGVVDLEDFEVFLNAGIQSFEKFRMAQLSGDTPPRTVQVSHRRSE